MNYMRYILYIDMNEYEEEKFDEIINYLEDAGIVGNHLSFDYDYDEKTKTAIIYDGDHYLDGWGYYVEDMTKTSKKFPSLTFKLLGVSTEVDEIWEHYFKNGESERCDLKVRHPKPKKIQWKKG